MTATQPESEGRPHGRRANGRNRWTGAPEVRTGTRLFKYRIRLRESQIAALQAVAITMKTPFDAFMRTSSMRRVNRERQSGDKSVTVSFAVNEEEKIAIDRAASRSHVDPSQYIREANLSTAAELVSRGVVPSQIPPPPAREPHFVKDRPAPPPPPRSHLGKTEGRPHSGPAPTQNRSIGGVG